jgi:hypothetical protein
MAALPALSGYLARQWDLTLTGEPSRHGYNAVVLFAAQDGRPLALKLTWPRARRMRWTPGGHARVVELVA